MATRAVPATLQQLPNALTIGRLIVIPVFATIILTADGGSSWAAAIVFGARQLRESSDPEQSRLDPPGVVTFTVGLFCLILALIEGNDHGWSSAFCRSCACMRSASGSSAC